MKIILTALALLSTNAFAGNFVPSIQNVSDSMMSASSQRQMVGPLSGVHIPLTNTSTTCEINAENANQAVALVTVDGVQYSTATVTLEQASAVLQTCRQARYFSAQNNNANIYLDVSGFYRLN